MAPLQLRLLNNILIRFPALKTQRGALVAGEVAGVAVLTIIHTASQYVYYVCYMRVPAPFGTLRDLLSLERIALDTFWGGVFGGSVGLAVYDVWRGRRSAARRKLLAVGSVSIAFQTLNLAYRLWTSFAPYLGWRAFRSLGGLVFIQDEIVTNTYFQAALLILAAGLLMPRDLRDTVQVTENLWL